MTNDVDQALHNGFLKTPSSLVLGHKFPHGIAGHPKYRFAEVTGFIEGICQEPSRVRGWIVAIYRPDQIDSVVDFRQVFRIAIWPTIEDIVRSFDIGKKPSHVEPQIGYASHMDDHLLRQAFR